MPFRHSILVLSVLLCRGAVAGDSKLFDTRICLPPMIYAVPGLKTEIHFANAIFKGDPQAELRMLPKFTVGSSDDSHWEFTPTQQDLGDHEFSLAIRSAGSEDTISEATSLIRVVPGDAGEGKDVSLLIVGDSLTHASRYPNELGRLLSQPGNPKWTMLGRHHPPAAKPGIFHEGYGGWTWARFASKFQPGNIRRDKLRNSPFLFLDSEGKPNLNFGRYCDQFGKGRRPDFIIVLLGINDCFHPDPKDPIAVETRIETMFANAAKVIAAFRRDAPNADIGICLTPPGNSRDDAFYANYQDRYTRRGWKTIQFKLVERQIDHFLDQEEEKLYIIPTSVHLDTTRGYPDNNGVHPNDYGYNQIAADIYGWIKWRMAQ